jgi:hypothetical protein
MNPPRTPTPSARSPLQRRGRERKSLLRLASWARTVQRVLPLLKRPKTVHAGAAADEDTVMHSPCL